MSKVENPGLYIHIPFCHTKCPYCDFYSIIADDRVACWREALRQEILAYKDRCALFDSLYLGGGTPSLLGRDDLAMLFESLHDHFRFAPDTEITIEANPDDITREKLELFKRFGVTRISLGVQSLDTRELHFLGRRHTARQAEQALEMIRDCGFADLGVDLIYGLPGRRTSDWLRTMTRTLDFSPEHLSCYQLTIHDETPFGDMLARGRFSPAKERGSPAKGRYSLPSEEEERAFFLKTARFLEERGYIHYEISNFAREEAYIPRHNPKYWHRVPYLGLGPSAHSFMGGVRWWNVKCLTTYCDLLDKGTLPVAGSERLSEEQVWLESLYLGLRTMEGIDLSLVRRQPGVEKILAQLQAANLVEICGNRVIPTREGFLVADSLPLLFSRTC